MENRKYESANYKTKKLVRIPKEKHIVVENTHEPIVTREEFDVVQRLMTARHTPAKHNYDNIFKSIVFCMECGHRLTLAAKDIKIQGGKHERRTYYRCMQHFLKPEQCLHYHFIYYNDLLEIVSGKLKGFFALMKDDTLLTELIQKKSTLNEDVERTAVEKQRILKRLESLNKIIRKLYEDFAAEIIDATNYQALMKDYYSEQKTLNARLLELCQKDEKESKYENNLQKLKDYANMYIDNKALTREMVNQLIERIEVGNVITEDGEKQQEVNIVYRFIGTL